MGWSINGQKVWTSGAQHSDFGVILARTDPTAPKHNGVTMFVVDMHHPGVTVRPLRVATGAAPFKEVFFDDVYVPEDSIIGRLNDGWQAAVTMLNFERISIGTGGRKRTSVVSYDNLARLVREQGHPITTRQRGVLAELYSHEVALGAYSRYLHEDGLSGNPIGAQGSVAKLALAEHRTWIGEIVQLLFGTELAAGAERLRPVLFEVLGVAGARAGGGTSEIQKNIVGERLLGLPKDPGVDARTPFNQIRFGA